MNKIWPEFTSNLNSHDVIKLQKLLTLNVCSYLQRELLKSFLFTKEKFLRNLGKTDIIEVNLDLQAVLPRFP